MSELRCSLCDKTFAKANSLSKHKKRTHPDKPREKFGCFYCDYGTVYKFNLNKHMNKVHLSENGAVIKKRVSSQPIKICSLCNTFECADRGKMIDHYVDVHNVPINEQILNFNSFEEFLSWKRLTETQEYCRFVAASSQRKRLTKHVWFFRCFRDGHYMPRGKGQRSLKVKGSVKIGSVCPCSMKVTKALETGAVCVLYITPHVGHKPDVSRLNLTKQEREYIASMISAGVPDDELLSSLRDSLSFAELSRLHLTTRKDLWNIKNAVRIQKKATLETNYEAVKTTMVDDLNIKSGAPERFTNLEIEQALSDNTQKSSNVDDRATYLAMKQALIDHVSDLIDNTKNCAQLEVIRKALLPIPEAIKELSLDSRGTPELCGANKRLEKVQVRKREPTSSGEAMKYVVSDVISEPVSVEEILDTNRLNEFQDFYE